jgi:hypothetical protein
MNCCSDNAKEVEFLNRYEIDLCDNHITKLSEALRELSKTLEIKDNMATVDSKDNEDLEKFISYSTDTQLKDAER